MQTSPVSPLRQRPHPTLLALALAVALCSNHALAQSDKERIDSLEQKLERSLQQVQMLLQRVQHLEGHAAQKPEAVARQPEVATQVNEPELAAKVNELERELIALANRPAEDMGLALHGFVDVGFGLGSKGRPVGGRVGALDLYLTPKFGDRTKALFELVFEVNSAGETVVDVERLQIGYTFADELTLWLGRFHTPFGNWNTAFHHGAQLQTPITRPTFLEFEDARGILPSHSVGLWGRGALRVTGGRWIYDAYVANAPTIDVADPASPATGVLNPGLNGASNRAPSVGGNVGYAFKGGRLGGLAVGAHAITAKVADKASSPNETRLLVLGGWLSYTQDDWEVSGEYYRFRNRDLSGASGKHASTAGFLQVGRTFGTITPFARYERTALDQSDNYFAQMESGQSYRRTMMGVRYDLNSTTALKVEANRTSLTDRATSSYSELRTQWAVRF